MRAIEPSDIVNAFLNNQNVEEPLEFIKAICSATSANYPIYFLLKQSNINTANAIEVINNTTSRGPTKERLLTRLNGLKIDAKKLPNSNSQPGLIKKEYREYWLSETIPEEIAHLAYCLDSLLSLTDSEIIDHEEYIRNVLLGVFKSDYETASSILASTIRKVICRVDEAINSVQE